jgi:integrase
LAQHLQAPRERGLQADLLGHASVTVTLDTYSHAVKGIAEQAAADMDRLLRG